MEAIGEAMSRRLKRRWTWKFCENAERNCQARYKGVPEKEIQEAPPGLYLGGLPVRHRRHKAAVFF